MVRVRLTQPMVIQGKRFEKGDHIDVSDSNALLAIASGRAEKADDHVVQPHDVTINSGLQTTSQRDFVRR